MQRACAKTAAAIGMGVTTTADGERCSPPTAPRQAADAEPRAGAAPETSDSSLPSAWRDVALWKRAAWTAAVPGALLFAYLQVSGYIGRGMVGADSHAYWLAAHDLNLTYDTPAGYWDAFLYSPAFAQALWPVAQLGWHPFQAMWFVTQIAVVGWLVRPLRWWQGTVLALFVSGEFVLGNVYIFFAALAVLVATRRSVALGPLALTKAAPAVLGLWYLARGEWRLLGRAVLATGLVVAVSAAFAPGDWLAWVRFLLDSAATGKGSTALLRLGLSVVLILLAARLDRSVLLAPALILACPIIGGLIYFAVLLSLPRLLARDREVRRDAGPPDPALEARFSS